MDGILLQTVEALGDSLAADPAASFCLNCQTLAEQTHSTEPWESIRI